MSRTVMQYLSPMRSKLLPLSIQNVDKLRREKVIAADLIVLCFVFSWSFVISPIFFQTSALSCVGLVMTSMTTTVEMRRVSRLEMWVLTAGNTLDVLYCCSSMCDFLLCMYMLHLDTGRYRPRCQEPRQCIVTLPLSDPSWCLISACFQLFFVFHGWKI